ncbi:MAG: cupin domain-containing protein [bacterium]|jgi:mannose-6-phosphate isomerase-like protein (cupin superfamily)
MKKVDSNSLNWSLESSGVKYMVQGPNIEWGILKMKPGQSSLDYGKHIHHVVEETFYFISGSPKFIINGEEHRVKPGEAYVIEPYDDHCVVNDTDEDFVAIFIKHPFMPEDRHPV